MGSPAWWLQSLLCSAGPLRGVEGERDRERRVPSSGFALLPFPRQIYARAYRAGKETYGRVPSAWTTSVQSDSRDGGGGGAATAEPTAAAAAALPAAAEDGDNADGGGGPCRCKKGGILRWAKKEKKGQEIRG